MGKTDTIRQLAEENVRLKDENSRLKRENELMKEMYTDLLERTLKAKAQEMTENSST